MMMLRSLSPLYVTLFTAAVVQAQQPTVSPTMSDAPASATTTVIMDPTLTLEEIILSDPDLTTLALAVNASDIFSAVDSSAGYYTVFA